MTKRTEALPLHWRTIRTTGATISTLGACTVHGIQAGCIAVHGLTQDIGEDTTHGMPDGTVRGTMPDGMTHGIHTAGMIRGTEAIGAGMTLTGITITIADGMEDGGRTSLEALL